MTREFGPASRRGPTARVFLTMVLGVAGLFASAIATSGVIHLAPRFGTLLWATSLAMLVTLGILNPAHRVIRSLAGTFRLRSAALRPGAFVAAAVGTICVLFAAAYLCDLIGLAGPEPGSSTTRALAGTGWLGWVAATFAAGILMPLVEEAWFRGFIQRRLEDIISPAAAVSIAASLFGLFHLPGGPALGLIALILGLITGTLAHQSDSVFPAAVAHGAWNATLMILAVIPHAPTVRQILDLLLTNLALLGLGIVLLTKAFRLGESAPHPSGNPNAPKIT